MNLIYSDKAKQSKEGFPLLQQATMQLEEVLGNSAERAKAEWDLREDSKGRNLYLLRLSDWTGSAEIFFSADELQSPNRLQFRLHRLYGKLLEARNEEQLRQLEGMGSQES